MTWVVPEIGTDFTEDFEDLVIQHIFDEWTETNPGKGAALKPDTTTENDKISFKTGFPEYSRPYECCVIKTSTEVLEQFSGKSRFAFLTGLDIMLRMKRLNRDAPAADPQLENMEREVMRIMTTYKHNDILGIKDLVFKNPDSVVRVYNATDSWATSDWRSLVRIQVFYEKQNLTPL